MISIRPVAARDRQRLFAIVTDVGNFNPQEVEVAEEVIDDALNPAKNDYQILVAVDKGDKVIGFICFGLIPLTDGRWDLYWIAVDPADGRRGIGSKLLAAMEQQIGVSGVRIFVDTSSTPAYLAARTFYERNGYYAACVLTDFYRPGDDKVVYCKEF